MDGGCGSRRRARCAEPPTANRSNAGKARSSKDLRTRHRGSATTAHNRRASSATHRPPSDGAARSAHRRMRFHYSTKEELARSIVTEQYDVRAERVGAIEQI